MSIFHPKLSASTPEAQSVVVDTKEDTKSDLSSQGVLREVVVPDGESPEGSSQSSRSSHGNFFGRLKRIGGDWRIDEANGGKSSHCFEIMALNLIDYAQMFVLVGPESLRLLLLLTHEGQVNPVTAKYGKRTTRLPRLSILLLLNVLRLTWIQFWSL